MTRKTAKATRRNPPCNEETRSAGGKAAAENRALDYANAADVLAFCEESQNRKYHQRGFGWKAALSLINANLPPARAVTRGALEKYFSRHPETMPQARFALADAMQPTHGDNDDLDLREFTAREIEKCGISEMVPLDKTSIHSDFLETTRTEINDALKAIITRAAKRIAGASSLVVSRYGRTKAFEILTTVELPRIVNEDIPAWTREFWDSNRGEPRQ